MATAALDVEAARAQFPALASGVAFFDGPGGTQCPQSGHRRDRRLLARVERESRRRVRCQPPQRRARRARPRHRSSLPRLPPEETIFGPNMTTLNFALTRALGRTLSCRRRDPRDPPRPRRQRRAVAGARPRPRLQVDFVDIGEDTSLDLDDLERKLTDRTRVVAFPLASNALGTTARRDASRLARA